MKRRLHARERGLALIALLAVIALGASWFLVSRLNAESNYLTVVNQTRNAAVLNRAKQALIGYIAAQAAHSGENRPGAFPCPEAPADFNDSSNEGTVSYPCTLPIVGRFPWKTLGLDKLVDSAGEPLWYAIASGWAGAGTVINSNCAYYSATGLACQSGRLSVDGTAVASSDVVALIIAPGPAITVSASTNCTALTQARPTTAPPDWRNYLECQNATSPADNTFATTGPSGSFNDQLVTISAAEIIPAIEAAIAQRIEKEIVPSLQTVYTAAGWGFGGTKPVYPYAAAFGDPSTSAMEGTSGTLSGLLPMVTSETYPNSGTLCTTGASAPLCQPSFVAWTSPALAGASLLSPTCASSTATSIVCNYYRTCLIFCFTNSTYNFSIAASASNVGMALRQQSITVSRMTNVNASPTTAIALLSTGAASFSISGTTTTTTGAGFGGVLGNLLCGALPLFTVCKTETITIPINAVFVDHPLLDTRTAGAGTSWFVRNKWHELTYYSVVTGHTPAAIATTPGCTDTPTVTCMNVTNVSPANKVRAILVLAGRSINGSARPSANIGDYLEFGNATGSFERRTVTSAFGATYADTGTANAYVISATSVPAGATLRFKALSTNTGAATLSSPATGTRSLVNSDGSALAASTIAANGVVEVVYDGTQFLVAKRPFNDRVVVVDNN